MTLPTTIQFPIHSDRIRTGNPELLDEYLKELTLKLQRMYEDIADNVNGKILSNEFEQDSQWTPIILDSADSTTNFTYDHQIGWALRRGLLVDVWFDISWSVVSSGSIGGNMLIQLPYKVAVTNQKPFVGVVQPSGITFTSGTDCVVNAKSDTYTAEIWNIGNGIATANQGSVASGQLIGHLRYIGQNNEARET